MSGGQLLDSIPVLGVFALVAIVLVITFETGFRIGRWWQARTPDEKEGPTSMLVGSLLALMAFLLAVTMGMAADRFDGRRQAVLNEANAIGTTYLRAGYLPEPYASKAQALLRQYVPLRINSSDRATRDANFAQSALILDELWKQTEDLVRSGKTSDVYALYVESLNETIDMNETRVTAIVYARVPETILLVLLTLAALSLGMVGYSAGLTGHRSVLTALVLVVVLSGVLTIVIDLDRPQDGFLRVSQQPIVDLQEQVGPP